jgi:uncharacterized protein (TIGR03086 family)
MEIVEALAATFDRTQSVIAGIAPDQLSAPTPCSEWDVRTLQSHTAGVVANMGLGVRGETLLPEARVDLDGDAGAQFGEIAAKTLAAWRGVDLGSTVDVGAGPMPAQVAAMINLLDTAGHTWDLARATGQPEELPEDVIALAMDAAQTVLTPETRQFAGFDPAVDVPADASPTARFAAFMGRRP